IEEAERKLPRQCGLLPAIETARFDPDVVVQNGIDGMASRLTRRLHRRHPSERLVPRAREDHRIVVHLIAAVAGLPDVAPLEVFEPQVFGRCATPGRSVWIPRVAAGPIGPVPDDGNEVRRLVANHATLALTGSGSHDQAAIECVPYGPRHEFASDGSGVAGERGND